MHIAYVEPVAGLNVYGRELLPHLAQHAQIDVVTDADRRHLSADVGSAFPLLGYEQLAHHWNAYDHVVLQLRNNGLHVPAYRLSVAKPGVAVLHDTTLSGVLGAQTLQRGRRLAFLAHLAANEGLRAALLTGWAMAARRPLSLRAEWPMNRRVVRRSRGVLVHNRHAEAQLCRRYPGIAVQVVQRGVPPAPSHDPQQVREALGLAGRFPVVASFGVIAGRKHIAQALEAFARLARTYPGAVYVLAGAVYQFDLSGTARRLGLDGQVVAPGVVDDETFRRYLAATDIGVNLRYPMEGETSSTALRLMSYGKPVLVTAAGSLDELPDACAVKIAPGPAEIDQIAAALFRLTEDEALRRQLGQSARRYVQQHHTWEQAARSYADFLEQLRKEHNRGSNQHRQTD